MSQADVCLSDQQNDVFHAIKKDILSGKRLVTLGGFAGTGKTTLIKELEKAFPYSAVCAFTGKAASILRRKGIAAQTIHGTIYKPIVEDGKVVRFELVQEAPHSVFIVDEYSMVTEEMDKDLRSFGIPVIAVGDHGQLEPVGDKFNRMKSPDYVLEQIHRNSGDIARFAHHIRMGERPRGFKMEDGTVELVDDPSVELMADVDQVICAYNRDRLTINDKVRGHFGYYRNSGSRLHTGERVICLQNNKKAGVFNGLQGTVKRTRKESWKYVMDLDAYGEQFYDLVYDPCSFGSLKKPEYVLGGIKNVFDYAYCVTAHKAQGDQWPTVLVIEQKSTLWENKRWSYTAASRAESKLFWRCAA